MSSDVGKNWIPQNTAILIIHGIGHQEPLETLDSFARGIIDAMRENCPKLTLSHELARKQRSSGGFWYDNYVRIKCPPASYYLDIYEYYWANLTEDKTSLDEIRRWTRKVAKSAKKFYEENKELGKKHGDRSFFFKKDGTFRSIRYRAVLWLLTWFVPLFRLILYYVTYPINFVYPGIADYLQKKITRNFVNLIGDIIIYNAASVRSKNYKVRKEIIYGAVSALRYLVEPVKSSKGAELHWNYGRVIVSGHSLGSQIAFDAINRLTHYVTQEDVAGFDAKGFLLDKEGKNMTSAGGKESRIKKISDLLCGLHTFGSPLDKIAFFLREQTEDEEYIRRQLLKNFHCFKQKDLSKKKDKGESKRKRSFAALFGKICGCHYFVKYIRQHLLKNFRCCEQKDAGRKKVKDEPQVRSPFEPLFEEIRWYNYFDKYDLISGQLDYYEKVKNIDIVKVSKGHKPALKKPRFLSAHGGYWRNVGMYKELVDDFICPKEPPVYVKEEKQIR